MRIMEIELADITYRGRSLFLEIDVTYEVDETQVYHGDGIYEPYREVTFTVDACENTNENGDVQECSSLFCKNLERDFADEIEEAILNTLF